MGSVGMIAGMLDDVALWKRVVSDAALVERAAAVDPTEVTAVARLRRHYRADEVAVALELCAARAKAVVKFGEPGRSVAADTAGVEQASGSAVAAYKAKRIRETLGEAAAVADLCCGVGGDSMALCDAGLGVVAVDHEPVRAWMTQHNTRGRAQSVCADVGELVFDDMAIHLDPARRNEPAGRRAWRIDDYQPGPAVIGKLIERASAAAIKLSPSVDLEALPWPGEVEFISDRGRLVQCVHWAGGFVSCPRRATLIDDGRVDVLSGEPLAPPMGEMMRYVYTFDPAVERAQLIGQLCDIVDAPTAHPRLGLLTSNRIIDSPWLTGFELIERLPWRPKRIKQWLASNDGGIVEVKTRGKACDPDREQRHLRCNGSTIYTVFVLRFETKVEALITRRLDAGCHG